MFARVFSGAVLGVDAFPIEVEVDCCAGLGQISIVGLPDTAIREACERVRAAIKACSFLVPPGKKWLVNLAPCDIRKEGPAYDLPIATGILAATGLIQSEQIANLWFVGELSLSGSVRPVNGVLPVAMAAKKAGATGIVVPEDNAEEASLVEGLAVYPVSHLMQVLSLSLGLSNGTVYEGTGKFQFLRASENISYDKDFAEVKGQGGAKRALEIAAAGRHNMLMVGPPGSGKSMLAERLPSIMPPLEFPEAIELTKLFSVAGLLTDKSGVVTERPFRSPHHSASVVGLVGGGSSPKPGEISLSHLGVLFLDELTEFPRGHLDNLRQPLESRRVTISRAGQTLTYPASFMLIAACNPCPCGYKGDPVKFCGCSPYNADRYWSRLSGPLLDRIDMQVEVARLKEEEFERHGPGEPSSAIRKRVVRAINRQRNRNGSADPQKPLIFNTMISPRLVDVHCAIDEPTRRLLARAVNQFALSARAYDRILRLARTIADLADCDKIEGDHVAEALRFRVGRVHR
ncbi:MAG: YifB family Mg chelatase-like AAA ATPase [Cyanobacteria bacterium SZAS LIN-3]|nr:YifB family Mg chelatase-like AAA ATPase [Cyanobacteria bacterium SZAS LIN-3]MBS2006678.1 YifB family Mg chelatase-like AAA ATPase [Cyanobacteria bacterium SZAS TMP-1]